MSDFASRIVRWQRRHGRHGLPWQGTRDAYRIWLSEVMLQQTQVATVRGYYERFLARFPDVASLAAAPIEDVMRLWSGLGYYARGRNLHRAAREIVARHHGRFPLDIEAVAALPGVGPSTAAAIVAFATGEPHAILDGNVKRVLARHGGVGGAPDRADVLARLWQLARSRLPRTGVEAYTQGLMDLGATVCTRAAPACGRCPVADDCTALREGRIDELPGRKSRKAAPLRKAAWLVLECDGAVLVERRPASGLWGGLWCLPQSEEGMDPHAWAIACTAGAPVTDEMPPLRHAFTHFTLEATPLRVRLPGPCPAPVGERRWLPLLKVAGEALPTPVRKLLEGLA